MDSAKVLEALSEEEREFLVEMLEPEMHEGTQTLKQHQQEVLVDVEDIEDFSNAMSRQKRRLDFIGKLYSCLERSSPSE